MALSTRSSSSNPDPIATQLAAISSRLESLESLKADVASLKARAVSHGGSSWRFNKIVFPAFSGGDPRGWILKAEKYFRYYQIPEHEKVEVASMHLEGDALDLFSWLSTEQPISFWDELVHALQKTFGPAEFHNPDEYLCSIKQTGTVQEYRQEFAKRSARVSNWPDNCLLGVFLNGLKDELKADVRIHKPRNVYNAMSFALEYESKLSHTQSGKNPTPKPHLPETKNLPSTLPQSTVQPKQPLRSTDTKKEVKHVKEEPAKASKGSSKPAVGPSATGPVTEEEVTAVLLHKAPVTTQDLVAMFKSRLGSKEDKSAFAEILRRICMIQKKTNGPNYVLLRDK